MMRLLAPLVAGLLFGLGLTVSGMINPEKVLSFLDVARAWDPSLGFVMAGAIPVAALGFALGHGRPRPVCAPTFHPPAAVGIDAPLVIGAVLFGIGWGLAGFCPGPALATVLLGGWRVPLFVVAMLVGMAGHAAIGRTSPVQRRVV